eukprot:jgi/Tetstr1/435336/TSEL_024254.t1
MCSGGPFAPTNCVPMPSGVGCSGGTMGPASRVSGLRKRPGNKVQRRPVGTDELRAQAAEATGAQGSMRQIVEKKMLEARVVAPTQNISHKLADVHNFPAVKESGLENVDKEISDRNKLWVPEMEA